MTDAPPKKEITKAFLFLVAPIAIIAIGIVLFYSGVFKHHDFLEVVNAGADTEITAILETDGKAHALEAETRNGKAIFKSPTQEPSIPYEINITLHKDAIYRDVRMSVSGAKVHLVAEGFTPKGSFSWQDQDDLHFDWSGRIELQQDLAGHKGPICFDAVPISICHTIPKVSR